MSIKLSDALTDEQAAMLWGKAADRRIDWRVIGNGRVQVKRLGLKGEGRSIRQALEALLDHA